MPQTVEETPRLTSTSYLVLGLVQRGGPITPYDLKRQVAATLGHFWSFPHALLYKEPARLVELGLLTEEREPGGRRRRMFTITADGRAALGEWLARPSLRPTELRDAGLLQLFFMDMGTPAQRRVLAEAQLDIHLKNLATYKADWRAERESDPSDPTARTVERWRGETLPMGLLYERAAVEFWTAVVASSVGEEAIGDTSPGEDEGAGFA